MANRVRDQPNFFDAKTSQIEYYYLSRLPGEPIGGVADRHVHSAEPLAVRLTLAGRGKGASAPCPPSVRIAGLNGGHAEPVHRARVPATGGFAHLRSVSTPPSPAPCRGASCGVPAGGPGRIRRRDNVPTR